MANKPMVVEALSREEGEVFPGIYKTPGVCGGSACIGRTRITVWGIWRLHELGASDSKILGAYPHLSPLDLANAFTFAQANQNEIQCEIQENESDEE
jgi:uncharacterized protein (DUF433 family)